VRETEYLQRHAAAVRELHRVGEQVEQHLLHLHPVGENLGAVVGDDRRIVERLLPDEWLDLLADSVTRLSSETCSIINGIFPASIFARSRMSFTSERR
jgi:hypothetical protein